MKSKLIKIWGKCCRNELCGSFKEISHTHLGDRYIGFVINRDFMISLDPTLDERNRESKKYPVDKFTIRFGLKSKLSWGTGFVCDSTNSAELTIYEFDTLVKQYTLAKMDFTKLIDSLL